MSRRSLLLRLRSDRRATTAMIFAIALLPLVAMAALAMNFSSAIVFRSRMKAASDAALLTATQSAIAIFRANPLASGTDFDPAADDGETRFWAQVGETTATNPNAPDIHPPIITITRTGGKFVSSITYRGSYPLMFADLVGGVSNNGKMNIRGHGEMTMSVLNYVDVQLVMDISGSMLVTADGSGTDLNTAIDATSGLAEPSGWWTQRGCAFACHWNAAGHDFYNIAEAHNVKLRLDQLKHAGSTMASRMKTLSDSGSVPGQYRLGLFTFSVNDDAPVQTGNDWYGTAIYTTPTAYYPATDQLLTMGANVDAVVPPLSDPWHAYNTELSLAVTKFATNFLPMSGDGSTASSPREFVILMTDGLDDHRCQGVQEQGFSCDGSNRIQVPIAPSACDALHAKNAIVAVLHTEIWGVGPDAQTLAQTHLQACASPGLYFPVASDASIDQAMQKVLDLASAKAARFTN